MKLIQKLALAGTRLKFRILSLLSKKKAARQAFRLFCTPQYRNSNPLPAVFERADRQVIPFRNETVTGYEWNKKGIKTVLVVHGFESSVVNFDRYISAFVEKDYHVLAFDAPAHGRSTGKRTNVMDYQQLLRLVIDRYGPVHYFIAHSLGGLALCLALADNPQVQQGRMVLVAPATETHTAVKQFFSLLRISDPGVQAAFYREIADISGHNADWFSVSRALLLTGVQTLWVHDRQDAITPWADAEKVRDMNIPGVRFLVTEGLGHRRIYRDETVMAAILSFL